MPKLRKIKSAAKKAKNAVSSAIKKRREQKQKEMQSRKWQEQLRADPKSLMRNTITSQNQPRPTKPPTRLKQKLQKQKTKQPPKPDQKQKSEKEKRIAQRQKPSPASEPRPLAVIKEGLKQVNEAIKGYEENLVGAQEAAKQNSSFRNVVDITESTLRKLNERKKALQKELETHPQSRIKIVKEEIPHDEQSGEH